MTISIFTPATEAQILLIRKLATEQGTVQPTLEQIASWDKAKASQIIGWYLARQDQAPKAPKAPVEKVEVPAGRYAVHIDGDTNELSFFCVDRPEEGKWAGYTFVKQIVSDDEFPVKGVRKAKVLAAIGRDVREASLTYGREIQVCGVCNRTLTNDESRERGIGPICAEKMGW